jgi:hypothetical protein
MKERVEGKEKRGERGERLDVLKLLLCCTKLERARMVVRERRIIRGT